MTSEKTELLKRYILLAVALYICAMGVAVIVLSHLGTSPISSWAYVLSLHTPLTVGGYTMILNVILILLQVMMLGWKKTLERRNDMLMQVPVSLLFSASVDINMLLCESFIPEIYVGRVLTTVLGCLVMALGIALQVKANVSMNSGEYFVQILSQKIQKAFGTVKIGFDMTLVVIAIATSLLLAGRIDGIREGTLISALLVGPFVRIISPHIGFLNSWLTGGATSSATSAQTLEQRHHIITITREYGSGGHLIGEQLAKRLGIPFYDNSLISMVARESGFTEKYVSEHEQNMPSALLYQMVLQDYEAPIEKSLSPDDALFVAQCRVMRKLAAEGPCVILGRCADFILKDDARLLRVFLYADKEYERQHAISEYGLAEADAAEKVEAVNRARRNHYTHYTGLDWGDAGNYELTLNTGSMDSEALCGIIEKAYASQYGEE